MNAEIAQVIRMLVAVNAAAIVVMIPFAFIGSALALDGLAKIDLWLRKRDGRPDSSSGEKR